MAPREAPRDRRHAAVYQRGERFVVHSYARTIDGIDIVSEPCEAFRTDVADATLGEAVRAALAACRVGVAPPTSWPEVLAPLLRAAGAKSWRVLTRGARYVDVGEDDAHLTLVAASNLGDRNGFGEHREPVTVAANLSMAGFGALLKRTLGAA